MAERNVYGPVDGSVLYDQDNHVSEAVADHSDFTYRVRRVDSAYFPAAYQSDLHNRVKVKLDEMGFYRVYLLPQFKNDLGLVKALIERWRPETNSFHFRTGEATVTLQDIAILYGLPVDGRVVVAHRHFETDEEYNFYVFGQLGLYLLATDFRHGHRIPVKKFVTHVLSQPQQINDQSEEFVVDQVARCWAFLLLGSVMCADTTGDVIPIVWLSLFEDINLARTYSWGSAVLAHLYRELANASRVERDDVAGFMPLLQIWAWSRILIVRPDRVPRLMAGFDVNGIARKLYASRWYRPTTNTASVSHNVRVIRDGLDQMADGHVQRVSRKGRSTVNWVARHAREIAMWNDRQSYVVTGYHIEDGGDQTDEGYEEWYDRITRRYISPRLTRSGAGHQAGSAPLLHDVYQQIQEMQTVMEQIAQTSDPTTIREMRSRMRNIRDMVACSGSVEEEQPGPSSAYHGHFDAGGSSSVYHGHFDAGGSSSAQPRPNPNDVYIPTVPQPQQHDQEQGYSTPLWNFSNVGIEQWSDAPQHHRMPPRHPVQFNVSPVQYNDVEEEVNRRRSTRTRRSPDCGTGGHRGYRARR